MDIESTESIHTLKLLEAVQGDLRSAGNELQQLGSLLLVKRADGAPEPLNLWRRSCEVVVLGVGLPIVDVNLWET